jgi:hypothetical protein
MNCVNIQSPNGLHYTIIDDKPSNQHTYLKLSYFDDDIFEISIIKKQGEAVFDANFFKGTHYHYLFRMDSESLSNFLNDTHRDIKLLFCEYNKYSLDEVLSDSAIKNIELSNHYLYIGKNKFQIHEQLNDDKSKTYTYHQPFVNNPISRLVTNHSVTGYNKKGYPIKGQFNHYQIVGDHFSLFGVFKNYYNAIFSLKYSEKTLELYVASVNNYSYTLYNQSFDDMQNIFKKEFLTWLAIDGTPSMQAVIKEHDFTDVSCDDCLNLLEMAVI